MVRVVNRVTKNLLNRAGSLLALALASLAILFIGSFIGLAVLDIIMQILDQQSPDSDPNSSSLPYSADGVFPNNPNKLAYDFALLLAISNLPIALICLMAHSALQKKTCFQSCIGMIQITDFFCWFVSGIFFIFLCIGVILLLPDSQFGLYSRAASYYMISGPFCALAFAWSLQAMAEEFLFRGLLLPATGCKIGIPGAIVFNAVLFALLHGWNEETSLLMLVNIGIFGVSVCLLTLYTGRIWAAVGLHAGWNFAQDYLAGIPVSGSGPRGHPALFQLATQGPGWITGGAPGLEGSILTTLMLSGICFLYLLKLRARHKKLEA